MIINNKENHIVIVPFLGQNAMVMGKITLLPGHNVVDEKPWAAARSSIEEKIKAKKIVEVDTEVKETIHPTTKKKTVEVKGVDLKDLDAEKAAAVVSDTYNLKTLEAWKKEEKREDVRIAILNQIEAIEKHGGDKDAVKKGKKKKDNK